MPGNSFVLVDDDAVLLQPEGTVFFHLCVGMYGCMYVCTSATF